MAIALVPKLILTLISEGRRFLATQKTQRAVKWAIFQANTAALHATLSRLRKFHAFLAALFSPLRIFTMVKILAANPFLLHSFHDAYLSTESGPASFFGNRSIVIHEKNSTRLTCANFTLVAGAASNGTASNGTVSPNNTIGGGSNPSPSPSPYEGGAMSNMVSTGAILAGLAAFVL